MANALASMIQREQDTDREKRNALAPDINWVTPNVGQVIPKWVSTSEVPWIERAYRDAKDVGDVVVRGALDIPNKLMMAVTDREAPAWALRNLTPAGQMVQGANQFAAGLRGTEVAENIWDQPEPLADAPWLQRAGNMATGIANMALAYTPMEKAVGGAVGSIGAKVADKWPMQKAIYVGPKSKAWATRPQVGTEGETVPEGAFSSLYDRKPRIEIDDSGAQLATPKTDRETFLRMVNPGTTLDESLQHPELFAEYPQLRGIGVSVGGGANEVGASYNEINGLPQINMKGGVFLNKGAEPKKVMIHELQHAIQEREGFARGGSPKEFTKQAEAQLARDALSWANELRRKRAEYPNADVSALQSAVVEDYQKMGAMELIPSREARDLASQPYVLWGEKNPNKDYAELKSLVKTYGLDRKVTPTSSMDAYRNLAGEIEARDAAVRANMTMAERRTTPPYSSENIPVEDAIVRFDRNGPQEMADAPWTEKSEQVEGYVEGPERDANFKKWFGKSKVVDKRKKPLTMFHFSNAENITGFDPNAPNSEDSLGGYGAIWFSPNRDYAKAYGSNEYSVNLSARKLFDTANNPSDRKLFDSWILDRKTAGEEYAVYHGLKPGYQSENDLSFGNWHTKKRSDGSYYPAYDNNEWLVDKVKEAGYDGLIVSNGNGQLDFGVFRPTQIKSKFNRGTFNPKDPRILYGAGAGLAAYGATQDNKDVSDAPWLGNE